MELFAEFCNCFHHFEAPNIAINAIKAWKFHFLFRFRPSLPWGSEFFMDFQFTPRSNDLSLSAIFASLPRPRFGLLIFPIHGFFLYFTSYVLHFSFFFAVLVQTYETRFVFVLHFCFVISIFSLFLAVIINSFAIRGPRRDG